MLLGIFAVNYTFFMHNHCTMWLMCIKVFDPLLNNFEVRFFLWWMSLALNKINMKFHFILSKFNISMNFQNFQNSDCSICHQGIKY